jgi:hypothetical protein
MAQLIVGFDELLGIARKARPFPEAIREIRCEGDTVHVRVNLQSQMPAFLRAVSPVVDVALRYRTYEDGVVTFEVATRLFSLPVSSVVRSILGLLSLPEHRGIRISAPRGGETPFVHVDLHALLADSLRGVVIERLYLHEGEIIVLANLERLELPA